MELKNFQFINKENSINEILGFYKDEYLNNFIYTSEKPYDLRKSDYINMFITNVNNSVLKLNKNNNVCNYDLQVEDLLEIDKLDIEFKDDKNNNYDFNNLDHKLEFEIITEEE